MPSNALSFALVFAVSSFSLASSVTPAEQAADRSLQPTLSTGMSFGEMTGDDLFTSACQGCHMPDGHGATGAARYPALAEDKNLEAKGYPVYVVVRGQRAMPPIGLYMTDDQVAAVVNYVRTHFGNQYDDAVTGEDVKAVRP